ncbi:MAG: helix-turn-helix domain-containing protein [Aminipila sp.]
MSNLRNVIKAIKYIERHLNEKLDLDVVADAVHYSKYHLHRIFTHTVGLTIHEYVQRRRLTEAAKLLVFSKKPIIDIALLAGYESQQAFTSIFKAMYKQSPNQFRENEEFYPLQLEFEFEKYIAFSSSKDQDIKRKISIATEADIPEWMDLVSLVIDGFPCLIEEEHIKVLKKYIAKKQALMMKEAEIVIGIMMFSYETGSIDFLGVHPLYREKGVIKEFLNKVIYNLLDNKEISITTYREGDKADTGHRKELQRFGFAEAELLTEFGYPTQKLVFSKITK